mgnify:CR=1 FL=1
MKKLFVALIIMLVCILIAGCSKPTPIAPAASPKAAAPALPATSTQISTPSPTTTAQPEQTSAFKVGGTVERTNEVDDSPPVTEKGEYFAKKTTYFAYHGTMEGEWVKKATIEIGISDGKITMVFLCLFSQQVHTSTKNHPIKSSLQSIQD